MNQYQQLDRDTKLFFILTVITISWFWYYQITDEFIPVIPKMPEYDFNENIIINYFLAYAEEHEIPAINPCPDPNYPRYIEATETCGEPMSYLFQLKFTNESMNEETRTLIENGTHITWTTNFGEGDLTEEKGWTVAKPINLDIDLYDEEIHPNRPSEYPLDDGVREPILEGQAVDEPHPEFGTIAMMILAVAIISIIAVTAKSRVVPRF
jgi:predicted secreted protein with PEFG-CTERM motif